MRAKGPYFGAKRFFCYWASMLSYPSVMRAIYRQYYDSAKISVESGKPISQYFYRPISFPLAAFFVVLGFSANGVTGVAFFFLLASWVWLVLPDASALTAAILFFLFFVLDYADGAVARFRAVGNYFGKLVDSFIDDVSFLLFAVIGYRLFVLGGDVTMLLWGGAATVFAILNQNLMVRMAWLRLEASGGGKSAAVPMVAVSRAKYLARVVHNSYANLREAAPLFFLLFAVCDRLDLFVGFGVAIHCVCGGAVSLAQMIRFGRSFSTARRDY